MTIIGIAVSPNLLALILGISMVLLCVTISFLFQRKLFSRYRGKAPNAMNKSKPEP